MRRVVVAVLTVGALAAGGGVASAHDFGPWHHRHHHIGWWPHLNFHHHGAPPHGEHRGHPGHDGHFGGHHHA